MYKIFFANNVISSEESNEEIKGMLVDFNNLLLLFCRD